MVVLCMVPVRALCVQWWLSIAQHNIYYYVDEPCTLAGKLSITTVGLLKAEDTLAGAYDLDTRVRGSIALQTLLIDVITY